MIEGACQHDGHAALTQHLGDRDYGFSSQVDIKKGNVRVLNNRWQPWGLTGATN